MRQDQLAAAPMLRPTAADRRGQRTTFLPLHARWRVQVDVASSMAIIIAAQNGTINVHTNKAIPDSGAGYLSLALRQHSEPVYEHLVPGCNSTGQPFLSVVAVYNDTCVSVQQFADDATRPRRLYTGTMQVELHLVCRSAPACTINRNRKGYQSINQSNLFPNAKTVHTANM